ncbi:hypothetical protein FKP32DRAFT_986147 [Trametes sanguinea]|nr:hypothetical protein FKP32DRAFT_986147 [Trametes sanguinea]
MCLAMRSSVLLRPHSVRFHRFLLRTWRFASESLAGTAFWCLMLPNAHCGAVTADVQLVDSIGQRPSSRIRQGEPSDECTLAYRKPICMVSQRPQRGLTMSCRGFRTHARRSGFRRSTIRVLLEPGIEVCLKHRPELD